MHRAPLQEIRVEIAKQNKWTSKFKTTEHKQVIKAQQDLQLLFPFIGCRNTNFSVKIQTSVSGISFAKNEAREYSVVQT
jgi:hypothetical protein